MARYQLSVGSTHTPAGGFQAWRARNERAAGEWRPPPPRTGSSADEPLLWRSEPSVTASPCGALFLAIRRAADPTTSRVTLDAAREVVSAAWQRHWRRDDAPPPPPPLERIFAALGGEASASLHVVDLTAGIAPFFYADVVRCAFFVHHAEGTSRLGEQSMVAFLSAAFTVLAAESHYAHGARRRWEPNTLAHELAWQIFCDAGIGESRQHISLASFDAWASTGGGNAAAILGGAPALRLGDAAAPRRSTTRATPPPTVAPEESAFLTESAQRLVSNCVAPGRAARALHLSAVHAPRLIEALRARCGASVSYDAFVATVLAQGDAPAFDEAVVRACEAAYGIFARDASGGVALRELGAALATCCAGKAAERLPAALFALYGAHSTVDANDLCAFFRSIALFQAATAGARAGTRAVIDESDVRAANSLARRLAQHCVAYVGERLVPYDAFTVWWYTQVYAPRGVENRELRALATIPDHPPGITVAGALRVGNGSDSDGSAGDDRGRSSIVASGVAAAIRDDVAIAPTICDGWLEVKGTVLKRVKKRHFVLRRDGTLYAAPENGGAGLVHALREAVVGVAAEEKVGAHGDAHYALEIADGMNGGRVQEFRAPSKAAWQQWIDGFRAAKWSGVVVAPKRVDLRNAHIHIDRYGAVTINGEAATKNALDRPALREPSSPSPPLGAVAPPGLRPPLATAVVVARARASTTHHSRPTALVPALPLPAAGASTHPPPGVALGWRSAANWNVRR